MSGMRLPDAARAVFYHKAFFGDPMSLWTHAAMRGESAWTVGERELMAALTAKWNACSFCNVTARCADALDYEMLDDSGFDSAAKRLLVQGYAFGKGKTPAHPDHRALADALCRRTHEGPGETSVNLRQAMAARTAGGPPLEAPYDELARQIGEAAYKVTEEQVAKVVEEARSERAAYELIVASALGAGLHRWRHGLKILEQAMV
jgi:hypothetical protein